MPISYPLDFPSSPSPTDFQIRMANTVGVSVSPFTGTAQVVEHDGKWWEATVTLPAMARTTAADWEAFFTKLKGQRGTFLMRPFGRSTARGTATGTPLMNGTTAAGAESLVTDGWTAGVTGILKAGDFIQIGTGSGSELKRVLADANSDGSGNATIEIWPPVRVDPGNNSAIVVTNPKGLWRLDSNLLEQFLDTALHSRFSFGCREAF